MEIKELRVAAQMISAQTLFIYDVQSRLVSDDSGIPP